MNIIKFCSLLVFILSVWGAGGGPEASYLWQISLGSLIATSRHRPPCHTLTYSLTCIRMILKVIHGLMVIWHLVRLPSISSGVAWRAFKWYSSDYYVEVKGFLPDHTKYDFDR